MSKTTFSGLYDDILIDIFQYFSIEQIFFSFHNLIPNLSSLIKNCHIESLDKHTINNIIPYIDMSQVISCNLTSSNNVLKLEQLVYLFDFPNLHSLILHNAIVLQNDDMYVLTSNYPALVMDIYVSDTMKLLHCIFQFIPSLKRLDYQVKDIKIYLRDVEENFSMNMCSKIEHMKLNIICSWSALAHILIITPYLRILYAITEPDSLFDIKSSTLDHLHHSYLHTLQLTITDLDLINFGKLLKSIPNLKYCRVDGVTKRKNESLLQSSHWKIFFANDAHHLKRFTINYSLKSVLRIWLWHRRCNNDSYFKKIHFNFHINSDNNESTLQLQGGYKC